jgi:hypothetical protein
MTTQHDVKRVLRAGIDAVLACLKEAESLSRTAAADQICRRLNLLDARGREQRASCLKALRELETEGLCRLPSPQHRVSVRTPRRLPEAVASPQGVPASVDHVAGLHLRLVSGDADSRVWNELILREHPLGVRPLVGRQVRYLVESDYGYLGAIGFAAAALRLGARDRWIGWDDAGRRAHLDRIVCLSRLLIRPDVVCANLVSRVLALAEQALPADFERLYGYRPWLLETFIEQSTQTGSSHQAANWLLIGQTTGRGRQDRYWQVEQPVKSIYVRVLDMAFRQHMGLVDPPPPPPLMAGEGLESEHWASNEFGTAELGDRRLTQRLVSIAQTKGEMPGASFLETVQGQPAAVAGYYRFIERPDDTQVDMSNILAPHRQRTLRRMQSLSEVLCIHDTTALNFSTRPACQGLGVIGKNQTATESSGLRLHSSFVVDAQDGVPLGLLHWQCDAPELKPERHGKDERLIPVEEKDTYRWIEALTATIDCARNLTATHVIHVMDREADFFDLFHHWSISRGDDLIVRAKHNRQSPQGLKSFDAVARLAPFGTLEVDVPRKSARPKKGKQAAQPHRAKRRATLTLRWMQMTIQPPPYGPSQAHPPVAVWLLHAREETLPTDGAKPLEWLLLTTMPIQTLDDAAKILSYYAKRWRIEDWHRILKTCCRVEEPAHQDAECLKRLLAINMVIAWRIHLMTLLGREVPNLKAETLFSDLEIRVMRLYANKKRLPIPTNLGEAVRLVARLGGYLNRGHGPPPGAEVLWRGTIYLTALCDGVVLAESGHFPDAGCE